MTTPIQQFIRLSNRTVVIVPEGADPEAHRRYQEAKLKQQNQKPARRRYRSHRTHSKRTNYAVQVMARGTAQAELVSRVNSKEEMMTEAETEQRQAAWDAANPVEDYGLEARG